MKADCRWCHQLAYGPAAEAEEHPCCAFWIGQLGEPRCRGCGESRAAAREFARRQKQMAKDDPRRIRTIAFQAAPGPPAVPAAHGPPPPDPLSAIRDPRRRGLALAEQGRSKAVADIESAIAEGDANDREPDRVFRRWILDRLTRNDNRST